MVDLDASLLCARVYCPTQVIQWFIYILYVSGNTLQGYIYITRLVAIHYILMAYMDIIYNIVEICIMIN